MQISHAEFRLLIQTSLDYALSANEKASLHEHLLTCQDCTIYFNRIKEMEYHLLSTMKKHWGLTPTPLAMETLMRAVARKKRKVVKIQMTMLVTALCLFMFGIWQFASDNNEIYQEIQVDIFPIPLPSVQTANAYAYTQGCSNIIYIVQKGDTINSISTQFSMSKEVIMQNNDLHTEYLKLGMEISIHHCDPMPSLTDQSATITHTLKPSIQMTTLTP